ncbi:MAG: hypothetical protein FJY29_10585 [Betaproteobacteria bacterium]|nr:hypothetical protein [Betaproteobacteria bacterium]
MSDKKIAPTPEEDLSRSFQTFNTLNGEVPDDVQGSMKIVEKKIAVELVRSRKRFFAAYAFLSVLGYLFSLSLCSQNSIALTAFSLDTAALLHRLPDPLCPVVCGLFFTFVPALCLLFFLDRFQMRRLVREFWWLPVLTALLTCLLMVFLPGAYQHAGMHAHHQGVRHTQGDALWLLWWTLAAISLPALGAFVLNRRFQGEQ